MQQFCIQCQAPFEITDEDLAFYEQISPEFSGQKYQIPPPDKCPPCRMQQRLIWRPELHLFQRKSDHSGKTILSFLPADAPAIAYSEDEWWSDDWSPLDYGREPDFNRPFFEQFQDMLREVPLISLSKKAADDNCDYINSASWMKNCYLVAGANYDEDCLYGNYINHCRDCMDCNFIDHCELCYECVDCTKGYNLRYAQQCSNCTDSAFLFACRNCKHCFGCVNLVDKQYMWLNEQLTEAEYHARLKKAELHKRSRVEEAKQFFAAHRLKFPHRAFLGEMNENVTGNSIIRSRNCRQCYDMSDSEDCAYCSWFHGAKNCHDCHSWGFSAEECYMNLEVGGDSSRVLFSTLTYSSSDLFYSCNTRSSHHLFGCVSMRNAEYCIFNKQYTKADYDVMVSRVIEHMQATGEWGQFFPMSLCPMAYNQSTSQDYFPLSREQAEGLGARWGTEESLSAPADPLVLPDSIHDVDESICGENLVCSVSGKLWKIIPQEFAFYQKCQIPLPTASWYQRHLSRLHRRNPRRLWQRSCAKCGLDMQTSYQPSRPEIVYCEECYRQTVY